MCLPLLCLCRPFCIFWEMSAWIRTQRAIFLQVLSHLPPFEGLRTFFDPATYICSPAMADRTVSGRAARPKRQTEGVVLPQGLPGEQGDGGEGIYWLYYSSAFWLPVRQPSRLLSLPLRCRAQNRRHAEVRGSPWVCLTIVGQPVHDQSVHALIILYTTNYCNNDNYTV